MFLVAGQWTNPPWHADNSLDSHWRLNHIFPSAHYISIKEKSTTSSMIEQSVNFLSNCVIPHVYLKVNPISRGNCECGTLVIGYKAFSLVGVTVVTRPNRALLGCISNVAIMSLCPDSCEWDREVIMGNFIRSLARGEPRHVHLCQGNPELGWQITDTWALKEMRTRASLGHHNPFGKVFHLSQTVVTGLG